MNHKTLTCTLSLTLLTMMAETAQSFDHQHQALAQVLEKHVSVEGVDYAALREDPNALQTYLDQVSKVSRQEFQGWSENQQLALLMNLYNAATLQLIIDHYPVKGIRSIGGLFKSPWDLKVVRLWGGSHSLDWLEHELIREDYNEPRIHFALVCAAKSCPPLRSEPFFAEKLDEQLDDQARTFLRQSAKNRYDTGTHTLHLSPIFKWYRDDFTQGGTTLFEYVKPYMEGPFEKSGRPEIEFTDYDWSLNDVKKGKDR